MLLVGLTGGIGSGKSTVAAMLVSRGAVLLDADAIVHELQQPGQPTFDAMVELLGPQAVGADGTLDRQWIADRVFVDPEALAQLNAIVHPAVRHNMAERVLALVETDSIVVMDVPLLTESGMVGMAGVIVVDVDPAVAVERLIDGRGFTREDAEARIARQASREERLALADQVIDNSGPLAALKPQVDRVWAWLVHQRDGGEESSGSISFEPPKTAQ